MFAVIYRFKLKPHQESQYVSCWNKIADFFINKKGALGSCLHKSEENVWVAYSRWPSKALRDAAWPDASLAIDQSFPLDVREAMQSIRTMAKENSDLEQYDEICLNVIEDKIFLPK